MTRRRASPAFLLPALWCLLLAGSPRNLAAQGFDSPLVPGGRLRVQVSPGFTFFDERFGLREVDGSLVEETEPLGLDYSVNRLGTARFPSLEDDQAALARALEGDDFALHLGSVRTIFDASSTRIPFSLDLGITDWLTVGVMVPMVRRRVEASLRLSSLEANVGVSPLLSDPGAPSAFLSEFLSALGDTRTRVDALCSDLGEGSGACQDARGLLLDASRTFEGLEDAYTGSELFFLEGTDPATRITTGVEAIQARMGALGVEGFTALPPMASQPLSEEGFLNDFVAPAHGVSGLPGEGGQSLWELGDVEASAAVRILDLSGSDRVLGRPSLRFRVAVGGTLRLGTATEDTLRTFLDLDSQRGTTDVELLLHTDLQWLARRLGLRSDIRYTTQGETDVTRRIAGPEDAFLQGAPRGRVTWAPGNIVEWSVAPRLLLTPELALSGRYAHYRRAEAEFRLVSLEGGEADPGEADVGLLSRETEATAHTLGLTLLYSTLEATRRGRTSLPFELQARWEKAVAGSGGRTPAESRFVGALRLYVDLWGG